MFQPGAERRCYHRPDGRACGLELHLVLEQAAVTLGREDRADEAAARALAAREPVAAGEAEHERERDDDEMAEEELHGRLMT